MIQFIHVGKCAGTSVARALRDTEIEFSEHHPFLGYDVQKSLHTLFESPQGQQFLITVRDPIKRFISAFYWDYYEKRLIANKLGPGGLWQILYDVFSCPNDVAEALSSSNVAERRLAKVFVFNSYLHAEYSLSYYVPEIYVPILSKNNCFVIRTESVEEDFNEFVRIKLGMTKRYNLSSEKSEYKQDIENYDDSLSAQAVKNLHEAYTTDYRILEKFYQKGLITAQY